MKKTIFLLILTVSLLLCGCSREEPVPSGETLPPQTEATVPEQPAVNPGYQAIIDAYGTAIEENWGGQQLMDAGLNFLAAEAGFSGSQLGYLVTDLDGDGYEELLIGTMVTDEFYGKMILDLYTLDDAGTPILLFQSVERDRIYYAGGFCFASLGSGSWDSGFVTTVKLEDRELIDMTYTTDPADYVQLELIPFG